MTRSAEKPRHARSLSSSRVIGPVVSCEPTVVILGSQYSPGRTPGRPHALPTIFCASEKPAFDASTGVGDAKSVDGSSPSDSRARAVSPRPMMSGMRPPARTCRRRAITSRGHDRHSRETNRRARDAARKACHPPTAAKQARATSVGAASTMPTRSVAAAAGGRHAAPVLPHPRCRQRSSIRVVGRTSSRSTGVLSSKSTSVASSPCLVTMPLCG